MEEIQTRDGLITNASFTDYLIPTTLDMPPVESELIEDAGAGRALRRERASASRRRWSRPQPSSRRYERRAGASSARVPVRPDDLAGL